MTNLDRRCDLCHRFGLDANSDSILQDEIESSTGPYHVTGAIIGGALIGAAGNYASAKKANKSRNAYTDSTSTQTPYMWENVNPGLEDVLVMQREMARRGAPQLGPNGQIYYTTLPGQSGYDPASSSGPPPSPQGGGAGRGGGGRGGRGPSTWTNAKGETVTVGPGGKPVRAAPGTGTSTPTPGISKPDLTTPQGIFGEVARRGLAAGNTRTQDQARNVMQNVFGAAGGGGSAAGGEQTGYEGYNPILDRLTGTLEGDVNDRVGRDLLLGFLDGDGRGGGPGSSVARNANADGYAYRGGGGGGYVATPGTYTSQPVSSAGVPDTMVPESFFGTQTRAIFDEQANDAELQAVIDAMNEDAQRSMYRDLNALDAASQGAGRLGGDAWKAMSRDAREEAIQEMLKTSSQVRVGDREARRAARLAALQGVNQRDLGLLGANVQREGIAAGERAAGAASAASAGAAADQLALARRGQDLSAIGALLDNERFSLGQLGDVGGQLSADRLGALGMVPGLEGIGAEGLRATLGAGGGLTDLRGQDMALRQAQIAAGVQRQGLNQQLGMFNVGQQQGLVNDYLRTLMGIGGMGGTSTTRGVNVQPGAGVSPVGAAGMGAIGGAATGAGIYNSYR